jgi:hypothetical protein
VSTPFGGCLRQFGLWITPQEFAGDPLQAYFFIMLGLAYPGFGGQVVHVDTIGPLQCRRLRSKKAGKPEDNRPASGQTQKSM